MEPEQAIYFSNITVAMFTLGYFTVIALVIGVGSGRLISRGLARRGSMAPAGSIVIGTGCGAVLTAGILALLFFSSLDGFYGMKVDDSAITLRYAFPPHDVVIPHKAIVGFDRAASHHEQGRLVLRLDNGVLKRSARGTMDVVERARQVLDSGSNASPTWLRQPME